MVYTLVSAAALGFDLARIPGGPDTADVVLRALTADTAAVQALAAHHPGVCRRGCWDDVRHRVHLRSSRTSSVEAAEPSRQEPGLASGSWQAAEQPPEPRPASREVLTRMVGAPLGNIDALDRFLRHDVLDWTWESANELSVQRLRDRMAADVLVDAAAAAYCEPLLEDAQREHLTSPYLAALAELPPVSAPDAADGRPAHLLSQVACWTSTDRQRFRAAVAVLRPQTPRWSAAMHDAGWAAHLSGRTRTAAALQLQMVSAFTQAGLSATDAAAGCWNALSGIVQGLTVADLLGDDELEVLLAPWELAWGDRPL